MGKHGKKLTPEQKKEIAILINAGIPKNLLVQEYETRTSSIYTISNQRGQWIEDAHITSKSPEPRFRYAQMIFPELNPHWQECIFNLYFEPITKFIQTYFVTESRERLFFKEVLGPKCLPDISKKTLTEYGNKIERYVLDILRNNAKKKIVYDDMTQAIVCISYLIIKLEEDNLSAEEKKLRKRLKGRIDNLLCTLDLREKTVLNVRYDPERGYLLTLKEIGQQFGITTERTRQIKDEVFVKLHQPQKIESIRKILDIPGVRQWVQRPIIYLSPVPRLWVTIDQYIKFARCLGSKD